jgi:hypothetical protein
VKTVSLYRISGDVSDASIASSPALTEHEVSIVKSKKKKNITVLIYLRAATFGVNGHFRPGPTVSLKNVLSVFIGSIKE